MFLLRAVGLGLSIKDLDTMPMGLVMDLFIEKDNDDYEYPFIATDEDINRL